MSKEVTEYAAELARQEAAEQATRREGIAKDLLAAMLASGERPTTDPMIRDSVSMAERLMRALDERRNADFIRLIDEHRGATRPTLPPPSRDADSRPR